MIVELVGGPMDGGWDTIRDDRAEVGSVHEFAFPTVEDYLSGEAMVEALCHSDFADPEVTMVKTRSLFYRLASIRNIGNNIVRSELGRMEFIP